MSSRLERTAIPILVLILLFGVGRDIPRVPPASAQVPVPQPSVRIVDAPSVATTNQLLRFTGEVNLGLGTNRITWDFGDGGTGGSMAATHAYRNAGSYEVTLTLTTTEGVVLQDTAEVSVTDSAVLQPGDSITFASPYVTAPPPAQGPPPAAVFVPQNVQIDNQSDQPLAVSYGYDSRQQPGAVRQADLNLALPAGYALQALAPASPGAPYARLLDCVPVDGQVNQAECLVGTSAMPGGTERLVVMAALADDVQRLTLPPRAAVALMGPQPADGGDGDVPALIAGSGSDQITAITWDGSTLAIAAPGGYAVSVISARNLPPNAESLPLDCRQPGGQPSEIECSIAAIPPALVTFTTTLRAPGGIFALPYADSEGQGTMTIINDGPEAAPGGASISVTLSQAGTTLSGSGVMRPMVGQNSYLLAFELTDTAGDRYLFQAAVTRDAGGLSGGGLWLSETDESNADPWSLGTPSSSSLAYDTAADISTAVPGVPQSRGFPLPVFTGTRLIGSASYPGRPLSAGQPPTIGQVGKPIGLMAVTVAPCCGPDASQTYKWSFGDGATSPPSSQQNATHTWVAPGAYIVTVVITDETGVSTFALTQIRIAAATPAP